MGSPPPTRGTLLCPTPFHLCTGITPAYAGNTRESYYMRWPDRDHPRLRGEHYFFHLPFRFLEGSPPPTRGTLSMTSSRTRSLRITPAYAGNTFFTLAKISSNKDHPRLRGEHFDGYLRLPLSKGSPPPTRGTLMINIILLT